MAENVTALNEIRNRMAAGELPSLTDLIYAVRGTGSERDKAFTLEEVRNLLQNIFTLIRVQGQQSSTVIEGSKITSNNSQKITEINGDKITIKDAQGNVKSVIEGDSVKLASILLAAAQDGNSVVFSKENGTAKVQFQGQQSATVIEGSSIKSASGSVETEINGDVVNTGTVKTNIVNAANSIRFGSKDATIDSPSISIDEDDDIVFNKKIITENISSSGEVSANSVKGKILVDKIDCQDLTSFSVTFMDGEIKLFHVNSGSSNCVVTENSTTTTVTLVRSVTDPRVYPVCRFGNKIYVVM